MVGVVQSVSYTHLDVYKRQIQKGGIVERHLDDGPDLHLRIGRDVLLCDHDGLAAARHALFADVQACLLYTSRCV